ncbi:MAG: response regulator transcription factor [Phycisphaerales bacterium]|nr:response regulator transcription factor [Phycisphaerales bacterium]
MPLDPTVFIVDDDLAIRQSLQWLLQSAALNVETYASAVEFFGQYDPERPGCLVLDLRMPGIDGLTLQDTLLREDIRLPIIFITGHGNIPQAVRAIQHGAVDFMEKPFDDQVLLARIRQALEMDRKHRAAQTLATRIRGKIDRLTPRELQVMEAMAAGQANKAIADHLGLSVRTVELYRHHIMNKLETHSLAEIVQMLTVYKQSQINDLRLPTRIFPGIDEEPANG